MNRNIDAVRDILTEVRAARKVIERNERAVVKSILTEVRAAREVAEAGEKAKHLAYVARVQAERQAAKDAERQRCLAIARKLSAEKLARDMAEANPCPGKGFIVGDNGQWVYDPKAETRMDTHSEEWYMLQLRTKMAVDVTPKDPVFNHMESWVPKTSYEKFTAMRMYGKAVKEYKAKGWRTPYNLESFIKGLWIYKDTVYDRYHTPKEVWREFFKEFKPLYDQPVEDNPVEFSKWIDLSEVQPPDGRYQHELPENIRDPYAPNPYRGADWMEKQVGDLSHLVKMRDEYKDDFPLMLRKVFRICVERVTRVNVYLNYDGLFDKGHAPTPLDIMRLWAGATNSRMRSQTYDLKRMERVVEEWINGLSRRQVARYLKMARQEYPLARKMGYFFPIVLGAIGKSLAQVEANLGYEYERFCRRSEQEQIKFELGLKSEHRPPEDEFFVSEEVM